MGLRQVVRIDSGVRHGPAYRPQLCLSLLEKVLPEQLPSLTQDLPTQLIAQALHATGHATIRRRRLPAEQVVWLVLCMALFRRLSIVNIVDQLGLALPTSRRPVVAAAVHQARARLGKEPLVWLFNRPLLPGPCAAPRSTTFTACRSSLSMERRCASQIRQRIARTSVAPTRIAGPAAIRCCVWSR